VRVRSWPTGGLSTPGPASGRAVRRPVRNQLRRKRFLAYGEPTGEVRELIERIPDHIRIWLR
jgi:hypothetical protein